MAGPGRTGHEVCPHLFHALYTGTGRGQEGKCILLLVTPICIYVCVYVVGIVSKYSRKYVNKR